MVDEDDPPLAWGDDLTHAEAFAAVLAVCVNAPEDNMLDVRVTRVRGLFQSVELVWCRGGSPHLDLHLEGRLEDLDAPDRPGSSSE